MLGTTSLLFATGPKKCPCHTGCQYEPTTSIHNQSRYARTYGFQFSFLKIGETPLTVHNTSLLLSTFYQRQSLETKTFSFMREIFTLDRLSHRNSIPKINLISFYENKSSRSVNRCLFSSFCFPFFI